MPLSTPHPTRRDVLQASTVLMIPKVFVPPPPAPKPRLLCGVYCGDHPGEMQAYADWMGAPPDLASIHGGENDLNSYTAIDFDMYVNGWSGPKCVSLPLIWGGVTLADAVAGRCDDGWNQAVSKMMGQESFQGINGHPKTTPFYVRIGWEQNAGWMKWATQNNGQEPNFILAFQRLVGILRQHDVENRCRVVWCPVRGEEPPEHTYPGDAWVDVVSMDAYWQPEFGAPTDPVEAWAWMRRTGWCFDWQVPFANAHGKGLAVSEFGVELDTAGPYLALAYKFFQDNSFLFCNYWESNAGGFPGKMSPDAPGGVPHYPNAAAAYRSIVRAIQLGTP